MDSDKFSVELQGKFIHLKTWGKLEEKDLAAPAETALALSKEKNVKRLLDDIRDVDTVGVTIPIQAKGVGIIWKLRVFEKVAILYKSDELRKMFFGVLDAVNNDSRFKGFDDEAAAVAWLNQD